MAWVPRLALLVLALASAVAASSAAAAPPARPELNPLFAAQWWLQGHRTVIDWSGNPAASDGLNAVAAWPLASGEEVVVAVADTGVDPRSPSLADRLLPGRDLLTGRRLTGDPLGHGTHVAALVAGNPRNNDGIFGVAPGARVLPLRVGTAYGQIVNTAAAAALAYAAGDARVRVINMSWGKDASRILRKALEALARQGSVLLVAAAGNDSRNLNGTRLLPQGFDSDSELTVASTGFFNTLSEFSNYGAHVEVAAPGERILSAFPGGTLMLADGTSMAAPMVSGVAALLFSRHPQATAAQVKRAIVSSCTPVLQLAAVVECGGIVNAPAALEALRATLEGPG